MSTLNPTSTLGSPIPFTDPHAINVSIGSWSNFVKYIADDPSVVGQLKTGYPRFHIHPSILKLAETIEKEGERACLFSSNIAAQKCVAFINKHSSASESPARQSEDQSLATSGVFPVLFPSDLFPIAKKYWILTGHGISSRRAEYTLAGKTITKSEQDAGDIAKAKIRARIATLLAEGHVTRSNDNPKPSENDIWLYSGGQNAILAALELCIGALDPSQTRKSVCFGLPMLDSKKTLENFGPGVIHFPSATSVASLSSFLATEKQHPLCLYMEFPSNPLLTTADLPALRALADKYDFPIIVDDTVGSFARVDVLPYVDILVSSLTKVFSGKSNVMGGSLVLNPASKYYAALKPHLSATYEDIFFGEDAIVLEENSRDLKDRIKIMDANAEAICDYLASSHSPAISKVCYPKYQTPENYNLCRNPDAGYGSLFSVILSNIPAAMVFLDNLPCEKTPNLGTYFTASIPHSVVCHTTVEEKQWATELGIPVELVRTTVGLEDKDALLEGFKRALRLAEIVCHQ